MIYDHDISSYIIMIYHHETKQTNTELNTTQARRTRTQHFKPKTPNTFKPEHTTQTRSEMNTEHNTEHEHAFSNTRTLFSTSPDAKCAKSISNPSIGVPHTHCCQISQRAPTCQSSDGQNKNQTLFCSEWCLPGGQIVATPRRSILHTSRGPQVPYRANIKFPACLRFPTKTKFQSLPKICQVVSASLRDNHTQQMLKWY